MQGVEIHDLHPQGYLSFDLKHILQCLHADVVCRHWLCESVECLGESAQELEGLAQSGNTVAGEEFIAIATRTHQVIWGTFKGRLPHEQQSTLTIKAIDSSQWEVFGEQACLTKIQATFKDVRPARYAEDDQSY